MADAPEHHQAHPHPSGGGTVDILGHKVKKSTALIGAMAAAAVVVIAVMRKRQAAQAAQSANAGTGLVTDPAGNQCAALDSATGYCPGTAQDIAAQQSATSGADLGAESGASLAGGGGGYYYEPTATGTSSTGSAIPAFSDNASWAQYAETALGSNGSDAVAAALAKYLSGQPVTTEQQTTIEEAVAIAGYPPVTGASGNPPGLTLAASTTTASTTGSTTAAGTTSTTAAATTAAATTTASTGTAATTSTAPASSSTAPAAPQTSPPTIAGKANGRQIVITWGAVGGATGYQIQVAQPGGTLILNKNLTATSAVIDIAPVLGTYDFKIRALNQNTPGPWSAVKQVTVTQ